MKSASFYIAVKEYQSIKGVSLKEALEMVGYYDNKHPNNLQYRNWSNVGFSFSNWRIFLKFGKDMPAYGSTKWHKESYLAHGGVCE